MHRPLAAAFLTLALLLPMAAHAGTVPGPALLSDAFENGLGGWTISGPAGASVVCGDPVLGCSLKLQPGCCGTYGSLKQNVGPTTARLLEYKALVHPILGGTSADASFAIQFTGGSYVWVKWSEGSSNRELHVVTSSAPSASTPFGSLIYGEWREVAIIVDLDAQRVRGELRDSAGGLIQASPWLGVSAPALQSVDLAVIKHRSGSDHWFVDNVSLHPLLPDADDDGIPDASDNCPTVPNPGQENFDGDLFGDACDPDDDNDALDDVDELAWSTDPYDPDTDNDGLLDGPEVHEHGSDPLDRDTDGDLFSDGAEVERSSDPTDPSSLPTPGPRWSLGMRGEELPTDDLEPIL